MRKMCLQKVYEMAQTDPRIFFVGSDLGFQTLKKFQDEMPERFIMEGICEANTIGLAAGLALEGKIPYVNTIATFISRRAYEQIAVDLCMHKLPVRLIGNGGGLVYAPLGSTHLALEDISIMRALPNMTVICPADADEMARLMPQTVDYPGPIYIRLAKGYDPIVSKEEHGFAIAKAIVYRDGTDVLLVTTGITLQIAIEAAARLDHQGASTAILHMHTIKPFDSPRFLEMARRIPTIISIEENTLCGGMGSIVAELLAETTFESPRRFRRIGIPDIFPDYYGSQLEIMNRLGISAEGIIETFESIT